MPVGNWQRGEIDHGGRHAPGAPERPAREKHADGGEHQRDEESRTEKEVEVARSLPGSQGQHHHDEERCRDGERPPIRGRGLPPHQLQRFLGVQQSMAVFLGPFLSVHHRCAVEEGFFDLIRRPGAFGVEQGRDAGNVGGGHARALERLVDRSRRILPIDGVLEDASLRTGALVSAGGGDVQLPPVGRIGRAPSIGTHRANRNRSGVGRGVGNLSLTGISRGADDGDALLARIGHRPLDHPRIAATPERHVDHIRAVIGGEADGIGDIGGLSHSRPIEDLDRHQRCFERDPGDALAVVGGLGDGSRHVRPVPVVIDRMLIVGDEVVSLDEPDTFQVRHLPEHLVVLIGNSGVQHRHDRALASTRLPRLRHADLLKVPLLAEVGIVGDEISLLVGLERLGDFHRGVSADLRQDAFDVLHADGNGDAIFRTFDGVELEIDPPLLFPGIEFGLGRAILEVDDDRAGNACPGVI